MFCQQNIERQAIFFIFNTNSRFPPFLLYLRCKSGVTFLRRSFRDEMDIDLHNTKPACIVIFPTQSTRHNIRVCILQ